MADPDVEMIGDQQNLQLNVDQLQRMLSLLRKNGLKESEEVLIREAAAILNISEQDAANIMDQQPMSSSSATGIDSATKYRKSDINALIREYDALVKFIDTSLDCYKPEFSALLYPIFANVYLDLIQSNDAAAQFYQRFESVQSSAFADLVHTLSRVTTPVHMHANELVDTIRKQPYHLRMTKSASKQLDQFLGRNALIKSIIKDHLFIELVEVPVRMKDTIEAMQGGVLGEVAKLSSKIKVYYGIIKEDFSSQLPSFLNDDSKKKRAKTTKDAKDSKKKDPNAPAFDRIPLPDWSDYVKNEKRIAQKETAKRVKITADNPPSICFFTVLNAHGGVCCAEITEDTTRMAVGYGNSTVQVFALNDEKLKPMRPMDELEMLDQEADDISRQMFDESKATQSIALHGHSGPVYALSYSPDKRLILSCSEDSTVRLWSTQLWTNLVVYRIGGYPIWDVKFSSRGYYFATASADRAAMLWSTDKMQPIRIFADAFSDCIDFHPNCNYIVGGSEDRYVRVWDILSGQCVRHFAGHKGGVRAVKFTPDGRYIVSAGADNRLIIWDVALQKMTSVFDGAGAGLNQGMTALSITRDGSLVAVGRTDNTISLYSIDAATTHASAQEHLQPDPKINPTGFHLFTYRTKQTPVLCMHFTRRNLLVGVGAFAQ